MEATGKIWILFNAAAKKQTKPLTTLEMQKLLLSLKVKHLNDYFIWSPGWNEWQPLMKFVETSENVFFMSQIPKPPKRSKMDVKDFEIENTKPHAKAEPFDESATNAMFFDSDLDTSYTRVEMTNKNVDTENYGYYFHDFKAEDIDVNAQFASNNAKAAPRKEGMDRRKEVRHPFKLEVILISRGGKTFRTYSANISLGGSLLEEPVPPEFLNGEFELIVINNLCKDRNKGRLYFSGKVVGDFKNPKRLTFKDPSKEMTDKLTQLLKLYLENQAAQPKPKKAV